MNSISNTDPGVLSIARTENSEKRSRFFNLASKRTGNVLQQMNILQKCFDKNTYDYSNTEVTKILEALEEKLAELKSAAERGSSRSHFAF